MPDVNCTVSTCKHFGSGNRCSAKQIIIQSEAGGGVSPDAQLSSLSETPAQSKDETCCQTFKSMQ
jgi:hypothetical protein